LSLREVLDRINLGRSRGLNSSTGGKLAPSAPANSPDKNGQAQFKGIRAVATSAEWKRVKRTGQELAWERLQPKKADQGSEH
jgi:hypothetical protein